MLKKLREASENLYMRLLVTLIFLNAWQAIAETPKAVPPKPVWEQSCQKVSYRYKDGEKFVEVSGDDVINSLRSQNGADVLNFKGLDTVQASDRTELMKKIEACSEEFKKSHQKTNVGAGLLGIPTFDGARSIPERIETVNEGNRPAKKPADLKLFDDTTFKTCPGGSPCEESTSKQGAD